MNGNPPAYDLNSSDEEVESNDYVSDDNEMHGHGQGEEMHEFVDGTGVRGDVRRVVEELLEVERELRAVLTNLDTDSVSYARLRANGQREALVRTATLVRAFNVTVTTTAAITMTQSGANGVAHDASGQDASMHHSRAIRSLLLAARQMMDAARGTLLVVTLNDAHNAP